MLKHEGIQFQVCKNPDEKCLIVERDHRSIRERLYKYLTCKNNCRYIDILPKFVKVYNDTVHSFKSMAPSRVTDSDILTIWNRMNGNRLCFRAVRTKLCAGKHVRISKE